MTSRPGAFCPFVPRPLAACLLAALAWGAAAPTPAFSEEEKVAKQGRAPALKDLPPLEWEELLAVRKELLEVRSELRKKKVELSVLDRQMAQAEKKAEQRALEQAKGKIEARIAYLTRMQDVLRDDLASLGEAVRAAEKARLEGKPEAPAKRLERLEREVRELKAALAELNAKKKKK
jgi:hypothetical protein